MSIQPAAENKYIPRIMVTIMMMMMTMMVMVIMMTMIVVMLMTIIIRIEFVVINACGGHVPVLMTKSLHWMIMTIEIYQCL